jgi:tRNA(Arg) A34 adenosine deaminase TadA
MRLANEAVAELSGSPCPFAAFGSVIVNHTNNDGLGDLVCIGANENSQTGNPSLHGMFYSIDWQGYRPVNGYGVGEIAAIKNCTAVLTDPHGRFRLSPSAAESAFADLTLYTNAESCPMVRISFPYCVSERYIQHANNSVVCFCYPVVWFPRICIWDVHQYLD